MTAHVAEHCGCIAAQLRVLARHPLASVAFTCAWIATYDAQNLVPGHDRDRQIVLSRQSLAGIFANLGDFLFELWQNLRFVESRKFAACLNVLPVLLPIHSRPHSHSCGAPVSI